jgi:Porin PorA
MTRKLTGLILAGAAGFFAALTVALAWQVTPQAAELPASEHETVELTASGASYYSMTTLTQVSGARLAETDTISGSSLGSSYPTLASWSISSFINDTTHHQELEPASRVIVFDRRTAELVNCCDASINGNGLVRQSGIAGYAFPVGTGQRAYQVFDTVLNRPEPVSYSGTSSVMGTRVYQFTESVSAAKAPPSPAFPSRTPLYSVRRVYSVDPETGLVLAMSEDENLALARTAAQPGTQLFEASLQMTPASVARLAGQDAAVRGRICLASRVRAGCLCAACVLALAAAWLLRPWPAPRRRPPSRSRRSGGEPLRAGGQ